VQVIDADRLALGLRLTRELMPRAGRLVVAVTQADVLAATGRRLDEAALEAALGVPVRLVSALDPSARSAVLSAVEQVLSAADAPTRVASFDPDQLATRVVRESPTNDPAITLRRRRTERIDRVLLHPVAGPMLFVGAMAAAFALVFLIADPMSGLIDGLLGWLASKVSGGMTDGWFRSMVIDGLFGGVGTVLKFLPQVMALALVLELLEATGYLARGAFLVDRLLRMAGLGGRSFVPLLMGHACAVPAIAATRIVRNPFERLTTLLVVPLMTCSARVPTYGLLISAFFAERGTLFKAGLFTALYASGSLVAVLAAALIRRTVVRGRGLPMVLEMPAYRTPRPRDVLRAAWRSGSQFLREVGKTIVVASLVLWTLFHVPWPGAHAPEATEVERSVAARVGQALEPLTAPLGFDWRLNVGLVGSFGARELMVSTLGILFGLEGADEDQAPLADRLRTLEGPDGRRLYDTSTALALLAFFVVACQCVGTLAVIRRETRGWRWPLFTLGWTYGLAWLLAFAVRTAARSFGA
jgi:ferrous iron transport protein B